MGDLWFKESKDRAPGLVFEYVATLTDAMQNLINRVSDNYKLYDGRGILAGGRFRPVRDAAECMYENAVKSVVDTVMSQIASQTPRSAVVTTGADYSVRLRGQQLERYLDGMRQTLKTPRINRRAFRDALIAGTGLVKVAPDYRRKRPRVERILLDEWRLDEWECRTEEPYEGHHTFLCDRLKLIAIYPEWTSEIEQAPLPEKLGENVRMRPDSMVEVIESWRLPCEPGGDDGKHGIFLRNATIEWDEWRRFELPVVEVFFTEATIGRFGTSLVDEVAGMQLRYDELNERRDECLDRLAYPRIPVQTSDLDIQAKLVPKVGYLVPYGGQQPGQIEAPRVVPPDVTARSKEILDNMFRLPGVGVMTGQARKPPDVRSAAGFDAFQAIEAGRHIMPALSWEEFNTDVDRHILSVSKEMYEDGKVDPVATWRTRDLARKISWSDVDMEKDAYQLSIEAASMQTLTPSSRKVFAEMLHDRQVIDSKTFLKLLGMPDVTAEQDLLLAAEKHVDKMIEDLLNGKRRTPEKYAPLELIVTRVTMGYLKASDEGAPEKVLGEFRRTLNLAIQMGNEVANAQAAAQATVASAAAPEGAEFTDVPVAPTPELPPLPPELDAALSNPQVMQ